MSEDLLTAMNELEERFSEWARRRKDVRAAIVVGSRARLDHPADEYADLDVAVLTTAAATYHRDTSWITEIADVWAAFKDASGVTYHVLFDGGLDAGIAIIPEPAVKLATRIVPLLRRVPTVTRALPFGAGSRLERELGEAATYTRHGYRVLFDKDGIAERFLALLPPEPPARPPSPAEFALAVNEFWFLAVWTAKHIWRGELWRARCTGPEGRMKDILLKMIEWQAQPTGSGNHKRWEGERFLEEWASPSVLTGLKRSFVGYDAVAAEAALLSMMDFFSGLSAETGQLLGYDHMPSLALRVKGWIEKHRTAA